MKWLLILFLKFNKIKKLNFGDWMEQEELLSKSSPLKQIASPAFSNTYYGYVNKCIGVPMWILRGLDWETFIKIFSVCRTTNQPTKIPLLGTSERGEEDSWNYDKHNYYAWIHLFCTQYGWTIEYVRSMSLDDAVSLAQETVVDKQFDKEFLWGMSEIAYPYNSNTKKSEFKALVRPKFMQRKPPELKKMKIPTRLMPMGLVRDSGGMEKYVQENL